MASDYRGSSPSTVADVRKLTNIGALKAGAMAVVAVFAAGWGAFATVDHAAGAAADARVVPVATQVVDLRARLDRHVAEESERHQRQAEEARGTREDLRELYRATRSGQNSARLETPLPPLVLDGGP